MNLVPEKLLESEVNIREYHIEVVDIPFREPVHLPFGTINDRPSVWLTAEGSVNGADEEMGAAEGASLPMQIPMYDDCRDNLAQNVEKIMQSLRGDTITVAELHSHIAEQNLGGRFVTARMTVEACVLDMIARAHNTSVYEYLTNTKLDKALSIPYGKSMAEKTSQKIISSGKIAVRAGAKRLKFKLSPNNIQEVSEGIRELKLSYPEASFMVDANGSFDPANDQHIKMLELIDGLGLLMIEEPVSRGGGATGLDAHRQLSLKVKFKTPIAIDDSIMTADDARTALLEDLCDIVNLKPGRVGSFLTCLEIARIAKEHARQVMVGGMYEATPGRSMTLTLAALCIAQSFDIPGDLSLPQDNLMSDLIEDRLNLDKQGNVEFYPKEGWGYAL